MKKSLSVAVVVAMVSSMFASLAFADDAATTTAPLTAEQKYEALKKAGVLEGDDKGANLDGKTTRAQIAKILVKAFGLTEDASAASVYKDLDGATWASGFIGAVTKAGYMDGVDNGKFDPSSDVTLEQLATVLVRAFKLEHTSKEVGSAKVDNWAKEYVAAAVKAGLVSNKTDFTATALRSDLVYSAYVASQGKDVVALTATKWEIVDSKNVKVTFSDNATVTVALATALEAGKATQVTASYKNKEFYGEVTLPVVTAKVTGVTALTNSKIKLTLDVAATSFDKASVSVKAKADGAAVEVKDATLAADGKSVVVTTAAQTAYAAYSATVGDVTKNFVGLPADTTKPAITSAGVTVDYKGVLTVVFNDDVDAATATNVANYTFDNNLTAQSATLGSDNRTVTIKTSAQTAGTLYQLTVQNVADNSGNVMDKKTGLYFGGIVDSNKPTATVTVDADATIKVLFNEKVNKDLATNVANYALDGNLTITGATIDQSNTLTDTVSLTTSAQTSGQLYKLTIKNVADVSGNVIDTVDKYFGGVVDTVKPTATVTVNQDATVSVVFPEAVSKDLATNVANYALDNNLTVASAKISDDNKTVTLSTSAQTAGTLYKLTVKNIADKAGNVMDTKDFYFGGVVDGGAPTIVSATTSSTVNNQVVLTFSEKLNKDLAQDPTNYNIDGGLNYPTKAVYAETVVSGVTTITVTLTTADQTAGKVYNVTVNNLKDLSGNVIAANSKKGFSGASTATAIVNLQTIMAADQSTLDLVFDAEPSDASLATVTATVYSGNAASGTPLVLNKVTAVKRDDNKKIVRVYFSNASAFTQGNVYTAVIAGVTNLPTDVTKNTKSFAGSPTANSAASVTTVVPVNSTSVKVMFNKLVTNIQASNFTIVDTSNSNAAVTVAGVQDSTAGILNNATSATLNLGTTLVGGHVYKMTFNAGITDPAGVDYKITNSDGSAYAVTFGGNDLVNAAPKITAAVAKDKYNFDIIFSEPVQNATTAPYTLFDVTANAAVSVTGATYTASSDATKVTVSLPNSVSLAGGHVYKLTYNTGTGSILDKQGRAYDTTTDANWVQFGGSDTANDQPTIVAVDATGTTVKVTFNENVTFTGSTASFNVTGLKDANGVAVTITAANWVNTSKNVVTLTTSAAVATSQTATIAVATAADVKDINGQSAKTDAVTFGTH